ncbi:AI-2E family transporter [Rhodoligotrophos ferricapiens]|uniref:AI-2E family transporter n=1 Tax=Rhodoligotrophos ferricapiens TaxID=3069264 RepID=UPI00315D0B3F
MRRDGSLKRDAAAGQGGALLPTSNLVRAALVVGGLVVLGLILWRLTTVIMLFFGAVVVATILRSLADLIERAAPILKTWSLFLTCLLILALTAGFAVLLGAQVSGQLSNLTDQLPRQISYLGDQIGISNLDTKLSDQLRSFAEGNNVVRSIAGYTTGVLGVIANLLLVVVAAVYFAARPDFYRRGCLLLFPPNVREEVSEAAGNAGHALQLWLLGQLVSMALVAVLTTAGLYVIGVPSALALGMLAGLLEFVPVVGPILSVIPAVLLALPEGGFTPLWVIVLYIVIQQVESNVILPLVQRRAVDLPPALTLFALLAFGVLFGPLGVLLATPLTVVCFVMIKQLYLRDTLEERVKIPGEDGGNSKD